MGEALAYISGEWVPHSQARIPVFDSVLMLGDCGRGSTRTLGGPFRLDEHLARL